MRRRSLGLACRSLHKHKKFSRQPALRSLTLDNAFEGHVDVRRIQSASLYQGHLFAFGIICSVLRLDFSHFGKICLVADQHESHVFLSMGAKLGQPALNVLKTLLLGDVINEQGPRCTSVIRRGDCTVSVLPSSIPNLSFNDVSGLGGNCARRKLNTDGRP